jgi:TolB protein
MKLENNNARTKTGNSSKARVGMLLAGVWLAVGLTGCSSAVIKAAPSERPTSGVTVVSPAGKIVYRQYLNEDNSSAAIFVMNSDGTDKVQLTRPAKDEIDENPDWSPDGSQIIFNRHLGEGTSTESHQLVIMATNGSGQRALTPGEPLSSSSGAAFDDSGSFSPDGTEIAYVHAGGSVNGNGELEHSNIYVMDLDGKNARPITDLPAYGGDCDGPHWSADGKQLVYSFFDANQPKLTADRALFIVNADGSGTRQLTDWSLDASGVPDWSASTNLIAFRSVPNEESGVGNFFTIRPDGSDLTKVTGFADTNIGHKVSFSPDGKSIVFGFENDGVVEVATAPLPDPVTKVILGSAVRILTTSSNASSAADWSPVS